MRVLLGGAALVALSLAWATSALALAITDDTEKGFRRAERGVIDILARVTTQICNTYI